MNSERLLTIPYDDRTKISYWLHNGEIYGLNEYEPVQFDIYGKPLGVRWECSENYWPKLLAILIPQIADHTTKACMEAQTAINGPSSDPFEKRIKDAQYTTRSLNR